MRTLPLLVAGLLTTAATTPPISGSAEEFGAATTACFDAQQSAEPDQTKITGRGSVAERAPAGWEDRVQIFARPESKIAITLGKQTNDCAVSWVAQPSDGATAATGAVADAILAQASKDFVGAARAAPPISAGAQTRFPYMVGNAFGTLIVTVEGDIVTFQFAAMNRARVRAPSAN